MKKDLATGDNVNIKYLTPVDKTGKELLTEKDNIFVTVGGVGVSTKNTPDDIKKAINTFKTNRTGKVGVIYDCEGWIELPQYVKALNDAVVNYKKVLNDDNIKHIFCPIGNADGNIVGLIMVDADLTKFDYFAPMVFYSDGTSYQVGGWNLKVLKCL